MKILPFLVSLALCSVTSAQTMQGSVWLFDDTHTAVEGAAIEWTDGLDVTPMVTDDQGQSPWVNMDPTSVGTLVVGDTLTPKGLALGFIKTYAGQPMGVTGQDAWYYILQESMPVAEYVLLAADSAETAAGLDTNIYPYWGKNHWSLIVPQSSSELSVLTQVAPLLTPQAVKGYLDYRGYSSVANYDLGTVMVFGQDVDVGDPEISTESDGFIVKLDLLGLSRDQVQIDVINFIEDEPTYVDFTASQLEGPNKDIALIHIGGNIQQGQLAILARQVIGKPLPGRPAVSVGAVLSGSDGVYQPICLSVQDQPYDIDVPSDGGGETSMLVPGTMEFEEFIAGVGLTPAADCTNCGDVCTVPTPKMDGYSCNPIKPDSGECDEAIPVYSDSCEGDRMRTPRVCRPEGSTFGATQVYQKSMTLKVQLGGSGGTGGQPGGNITSSGGVEVGIEATTITNDSWTADEGQGCGECTRWYRYIVACANTFQYMVDSYQWVKFPDGPDKYLEVPCSKSKYENGSCDDMTDIQKECQIPCLD